MSDLIPRPNDIAAIPTATLRAELARGITDTAAHFARLAVIWTELERRGEDLSDLRRGLGGRLPQIAAGVLAAEAVVAFAERPAVLDAMAGLPLARQRELAAGAAVQVLTPESAEATAVPLARLPAATVRLVLAGGQERTPEEQRAALVARRPKKERGESRSYRPVVDRERRVVRIGRMEVPVESLLAAFAEAAAGRGITPEELRLAKERGEGVAVAQGLLTPEEDERLRAVCRAKRLDRGDAVRQAVVAMWLL